MVHDYWLTDGIYGSLNCIQRDGATVAPETLRSPLLTPVSAAEDMQLYPTTLFGPTCDGMDTIVRDDLCSLPALRLGDWVVFRRMGEVHYTPHCQILNVPAKETSEFVKQNEKHLNDRKSINHDE